MAASSDRGNEPSGLMRSCKHCGKPIVGRGPQAKFCTHDCTLAHQSEVRKAERKNRSVTLTCQECGGSFPASSRKPKYCESCRKDIRRRRDRRRSGGEPDEQERSCEVCGKRFITKRYSQLYCDDSCKWHALNQRRIDKNRKSDIVMSPTAEMIAKRAAAIREGWEDGRQPGVRHTVDDGNYSKPKLKESSGISQGEICRRHIKNGHFDSALRIAAKWPRLGESRNAITDAWKACQKPSEFDDSQFIIHLGISVLKKRLNMGD